MNDMRKEAEILEAAVQILNRAQRDALSNDTAWRFLFHAEKHLDRQFKTEFDAVYREEILEAETLETV